MILRLYYIDYGCTYSFRENDFPFCGVYNLDLHARSPAMTDAVKPPSSMALSPLMVIPPGVVTLSISTSAWALGTSSRAAAPRTVWATMA